MRYYPALLGLVFILTACGSNKSPEDCKSTEGTQWSELKKDCFQLSESKFTLKPVGDNSGTVHLVFSGDSDKAEGLLPGNASTGVLVRADDVKPWMNKEWTLEIASGGKYALKKNNVAMYSE